MSKVWVEYSRKSQPLLTNTALKVILPLAKALAERKDLIGNSNSVGNWYDNSSDFKERFGGHRRTTEQKVAPDHWGWSIQASLMWCDMGQPNILLPLLLAFCLIVFKEHLGKEEKVHFRKRELASALCVHLVRMPVR